MKKILIIVLFVLLSMSFVACGNTSGEKATEQSIEEYSQEAQGNLLDYNKSVFTQYIENATQNALALLPYCDSEDDYSLVQDWHQCVVLYVCTEQIYNYSYEQYLLLENHNSYYSSQKSYLMNQILSIEAKYNRLIQSAPEYIEITVGRRDQNLINRRIASLRAECQSETAYYYSQINALDSQYSNENANMNAYRESYTSAKTLMAQLEEKFETLDAQATEMKNSYASA